MMFLKLSLNVLLYIVIMTMAFPTDKNTIIEGHNAIKYRSNCLVPLHYNLNMTLEWPGYVNGESNATIYIDCAIQNITLHISIYMTVMEVNLKSANSGISYTLKYSVNYYKEEIIIFDFVEQFLPKNNLERGVYTLYVKFFSSIDQHSKQFLQPRWFMGTVVQLRGARQLFPCWDEPELNTTFNISVKHRKTSKVLSNMPIREYEPVANNWMCTVFHTTPPMSTNEVAIMMYDVDDIYQFPHSTKIVNTWCRSHSLPHIKFAHYVAENVTMYLETNWKMFERALKVDYVAIPNLADRIWQTYGLISKLCKLIAKNFDITALFTNKIFSEADIIYNEELHPAAFKIVLMRSIAHDITYQRFGNLFNPSCRLHWWLNKGFNMFLETYIIDKVFPNSRIMDLFVVQIQHESRYLNTYFAKNDFMEYTSNVPKINSLSFYYQIIGAVVWCMLRSVIPLHSFWPGIRKYLDTRFTDFTETPDDLWNLMQIEIDDLKLDLNFERYNLNVKQMMDIWTIQEHCPVLNVTRDYSSGRVIISKEFHDKLDQMPYFIPVTYTKETDLDFNITLPNINSCLIQSNPKLEVQFNAKDKWIIVNRQQAGYYRVNYDIENWRKIAYYLNSEKYTNIHVLNRAQIIDDAFHLAIEKKLNVSIFWELASYLSRENDYIAWYPMIKVFEYISNIFAFTNTRENLPKVLKEVLLKIESVFEHIKIHIYDQKISTYDDFEKCLQQELAKWGCITGNSWCIELGHYELQFHLNNPTIYKIMPGWQKWTYCNGLKTANNNVWRNVWNIASSIYKAKSDYEMLKFLSCSEDSEIIIDYLQFVLPAFGKKYLFEDNENKPSAQEEKRFYALTANIFLSTLARHAKTTTILEKILKNLNNIKHSRVSMNATLCVMINNAYSEEQLNKILKFAKKDMQQSLSNIEHKLRTRSLELQNQMDFLQNLFQEPNKATSIVSDATTTRTPTITTKRPNKNIDENPSFIAARG